MMRFQLSKALFAAVTLLSTSCNLAAAVVNVEFLMDRVTHSFDPGFTFTFIDGSTHTFPSSASDQAEFSPTEKIFELVGTTRVEFLLVAPSGQWFEIGPGGYQGSFSFRIPFSFSAESLSVSNLFASLIGASSELELAPFFSPWNIGAELDMGIINLGTALPENPMTFSGLLVAADIEAPAQGGILTVESTYFGPLYRTLTGNADPGTTLRLIPEPSITFLTAFGLFGLLFRSRKK